MGDKLISFRVDEELKKMFDIVAQEKDLTVSQMLRHFMAEEIAIFLKDMERQQMKLDLQKGQKNGR